MSARQDWLMTEASGLPPSSRTNSTTILAHGWAVPIMPAAKVSSTMILKSSIKLDGRSAKWVVATNSASWRVSCMVGLLCR